MMERCSTKTLQITALFAKTLSLRNLAGRVLQNRSDFPGRFHDIFILECKCERRAQKKPSAASAEAEHFHSVVGHVRRAAGHAGRITFSTNPA